MGETHYKEKQVPTTEDARSSPFTPAPTDMGETHPARQATYTRRRPAAVGYTTQHTPPDKQQTPGGVQPP